MSLSNAPAVPADLPTPVEYGSALARQYPARTELLDAATGALHAFPQVKLVWSSAGYEPAGSAMRFTREHFRVVWTAVDGAGLGQRFPADEAGEAAARAYFARLTDPAAVAEKREEAARLAVLQAEYAARMRAENEARAAAERERRNALSRARRAARKAAAGSRPAA